MATCQICKRKFKSLKFETAHISICTRCVNTLNDSAEPATQAEGRLGQLLAQGMLRNANLGLASADETERTRARRTIDNFDSRHAQALPGWINRLLAKPANGTRDFKIMRAYRRGMLRMDSGRQWSYPTDWEDRAMRIRRRDQCCRACGEVDVVLDVHHIVYLSNYGTSQQGNLVALCRPCHEGVHGRAFDFGEAGEPVNPPPIRRVPIPTSSVDLLCPGCQARIKAKIEVAEMPTQRVRCPGCRLIFVAASHPAATLVTRPATPPPQPTPPQSSPSRPQPMSSLAPPPLMSPLAQQAVGASQWRGIVPDPRKARWIGLLRISRIVCALLLGVEAFWLLSAVTLAGGVVRFFSTASVLGLAVGVAWTCALGYAFHELRRRINEKHTLGYGYPHPAMKHRWAL